MFRTFTLITLFSINISCTLYQSEKTYLKSLDGEITLITRNALTTYYSNRDNEWVGFELELARAFAEDHDLSLNVVVAKNAKEAFDFLDQKKGHFIGAGLVLTPERKNRYRYTLPYYQVEQKVVCHRFGKKARNRNQLKDVNFVVARNTSYENYIEFLSQFLKGLSWTTKDLSSENVLALVNTREVDCTVSDSNIVSLQQRIMPNLKEMFSLSPKQSIHWFVRNRDYRLQRIMNKWLENKGENIVAKLNEKYYGYVSDKFDFFDAHIFERRIKTRLKRYEKLFKEASKASNFDWLLLAAVAYQESHWNPNAVSPTGVRGIMMLTIPTSTRMGVSDRTDPKQSIMGGARYLRLLVNRFKDKVNEEDLLWVALAAYNVGHGHIDDLIRHHHKSNEEFMTWSDLKKYLPLLTNPNYYNDFRFGYANGNEPLVYVDRIRNFYKILSLKD